MGRKSRTFYTEEEERIIIDSYGEMPVGEIAEKIGKDAKSLSKKIWSMKNLGLLPDIDTRNKFYKNAKKKKKTDKQTESETTNTMDSGKKIWNALSVTDREWVTANSETASVITATTYLGISPEEYQAMLEYRGLKGRKETPSLPKEKAVAIAEASSNLPDSIVDNPEPKPYPIPENEDCIITGGLTAESVLNAICNEELIAEARKREIFSLSLFTDSEIAQELRKRGYQGELTFTKKLAV